MRFISLLILYFLVSCSSLNFEKKEKSKLNILTIPIEIIQDKLEKTYYLEEIINIFEIQEIANDSMKKCNIFFAEIDNIKIKYALNESHEEIKLRYKRLEEKEIIFSIERKSQKGELRIQTPDEEVIIKLNFNIRFLGKCKSIQKDYIHLSGKYEYEILATLNNYKISKIKFEKNN